MSDEKKKPLHDKEGRANNYDEFSNYLNEEHIASIDDAIKVVHDFEKDENRNHYLVTVFKPALNSMYDSFISKVKDEFGMEKDDPLKTDLNVFGEENEKKAKRALIHALKEYMNKVSPSVIKALDDKLTEEETLNHLISMYDEMHGVDPRDPYDRYGNNKPKTIRMVIGAVQNKKGTLGDLVTAMGMRESDQLHAWNYLKNKHSQYHLGKFNKRQLTEHSLNKIKDHGIYDIDDKGRFISQDEEGYHKLLKAIEYADFEKINTDQYGIKKKEKKEE